MKHLFLLVILALSINTYGQHTSYETLTYKTKKEDSTDRTALQRLFPPKNRPTVPDEATLSAKVLVKGEASLYQVDQYPGKCFLSPGKKPFFFLKTEKGTLPLIAREQTGTVLASQPYWGVLQFSLQDWDEKEQYINYLIKSTNGYTAEHLTALITAYNKSKSSSRNK
jgi:hypothetical protein